MNALTQSGSSTAPSIFKTWSRVAGVTTLLALSSGFSPAAEITWGPSQNTSGVADLIDGSPVYARNGGSANITAGGIVFSSLDLGNGFTDDVYVEIGAITSTGDAAYDQLISSHTFGGGPGEVNLPGQLTGLTIGSEYRIQVFFNDQRDSCCSGREMAFGDGEGNTVNVAAGAISGSGATDDYGQFVIGTFTADATTQVLTLAPANGFGNSHYNAILVTGEDVVNVPPTLDDATYPVANGAPIGTQVAVLSAIDPTGDPVTYTIVSGNDDATFSLGEMDGVLEVAGTIDYFDTPSYSLVVEVSDGEGSSQGTITVEIEAPLGAADISWGQAQNTSGAADLIGGTTVFAANGGGTSPTVNGVTFNSLNLGLGFTEDVYTQVGGIVSTGDAGFDTLISSHSYGGGGGTSALPGAITGLTPGKQYQIQVFYNDQRSPCCSGRVMAYGDGNGNTADVGSGAVSGTGESDDYGQFVIGTFTAETPSQLLELTPANGFGNSHFNAILVTESGGSNAAPVVSEITYETGSKQLTLTWSSVPGADYTVSYSTDLTGFDLNLDDDVPASSEDTTTVTFTLSDELAANARLFFRVARNP